MATIYTATLERQGEHNDIGVRNGDFAFAEGREAYADILEAAVLTANGELIYNVNQGIPFFDTAFASSLKLAVWADKVKQRIEDFDFVQEVASFDYSFDPESGKVTYNAKILTDDGIVVLET